MLSWYAGQFVRLHVMQPSGQTDVLSAWISLSDTPDCPECAHMCLCSGRGDSMESEGHIPICAHIRRGDHGESITAACISGATTTTTTTTAVLEPCTHAHAQPASRALTQLTQEECSWCAYI